VKREKRLAKNDGAGREHPLTTNGVVDLFILYEDDLTFICVIISTTIEHLRCSTFVIFNWEDMKNFYPRV